MYGLPARKIWNGRELDFGGLESYIYYRKEVSMKKQTPFNKSSPKKPTPRGLPTMKEFREAMKGVDLWEMDKPPEVVTEGRKSRRPWLASK